MVGRKSALEDLDMSLFHDAYRGKRVLLTGHTGFKGSWLAVWLQKLGATVIGVSLPAPQDRPNHWTLLARDMEQHCVDIRDAQALKELVAQIQPDMVFHLAAQALVRASYREPLTSWTTNVMGTANLLEACRDVAGIRAIVVVTSDKCYENCERTWGYRENDRLGGHDPYSASKAAAELVVASFRKAFFQMPGAPLLATARAGNVIGGGDWSEDRLIPDLIRAVSAQQSLAVRSPLAARPWQHVLESLAGYLLLGEKLLCGHTDFAQAWNFGPAHADHRSVSEVMAALSEAWPAVQWHHADREQAHETTLLYLDRAKAQSLLQWQPVWSLNEALAATAQWYQAWLRYGALETDAHIDRFVGSARQARRVWVGA